MERREIAMKIELTKPVDNFANDNWLDLYTEAKGTLCGNGCGLEW